MASPDAAHGAYAEGVKQPATRPVIPLCVLLALVCAAPARAGAARCWYENRVVVVGAEVMGVTGDFILDPATPQTQLADSQAEAAGFAETALTGPVRLAGVTVREAPVAVRTLDLRTGALPTPVAGVIGADVLKGFILDVDFRPCRIRLSRPGRAPPFHSLRTLQLAWVAGRPVVRAAVSDGPHTASGGFSVGVGADTEVRVSDAAAAAPGAAKPKEAYPYGVLRPRLRAFSFAGGLVENLPSGLVAAEDPALVGQIGAPILSRFRLRLDLAGNRLMLAAPLKARKGAPAHAR
ncbi:MAG: hypothetical protein JSS35_19745 [Proteobacteria bacterium]|nr:hypothetical protein [Pseudomonadota bacterium]